MADEYPVISNFQNVVLLKKLQYEDHLLFLYTPNVGYIDVLESFLNIGANNGELTAYISAGYTKKKLVKQINFLLPEEKCEIFFGYNTPSRIRCHIRDLVKEVKGKHKSGLRMIINYEQLPNTCDPKEIIKCEEYLHKKRNSRFSLSSISAFDSTIMTHKLLEDLLSFHEKVIISTGNKFTALMYTNGKSPKAPVETISRKALEDVVKDNLETLILSMLSHKGMCGYDIIKTIDKRFQVKLSPGTIYPILHSLKRAGIIEQNKSSSRKVYLPTKEGEKTVQNEIQQFLAAREYLSNFINMGGGGVNSLTLWIYLFIFHIVDT